MNRVERQMKYSWRAPYDIVNMVLHVRLQFTFRHYTIVKEKLPTRLKMLHHFPRKTRGTYATSGKITQFQTSSIDGEFLNFNESHFKAGKILQLK